MILTYCDHCKKVIDEVAYVLLATDAQRIDLFNPITRVHLHWDCVPTYGRNDSKEKK